LHLHEKELSELALRNKVFCRITLTMVNEGKMSKPQKVEKSHSKVSLEIQSVTNEKKKISGGCIVNYLGREWKVYV